MTRVHLKMNVTEVTNWKDVETVVDLPDEIDPGSAPAVAEWLHEHQAEWQDDLAGVTGEITSQAIGIDAINTQTDE